MRMPSNFIGIGGGDGLTVQKGTPTEISRKHFARQWIVKRARYGVPALNNSYGDGEIRGAVDEGAGAVYGIDDKAAWAGMAGMVVLGFLGQPAIAGAGFAQNLGEIVIDRNIGVSDGVAFFLIPDFGVIIVISLPRDFSTF